MPQNNMVARMPPTVWREEGAGGGEEGGNLVWCCQLLGSHSYDHLDQLMALYERQLSCDVRSCYRRPIRSCKLKCQIQKNMYMFHLFYADVSQPISDDHFMERMTRLLSFYLDMELIASRRGRESPKTVSERLTSVLFILLGNKMEYIVEAIVESKFFGKKYHEICIMIIEKLYNKLLEARPVKLDTHTDYVNCILMFRKWKKMMAKGEWPEVCGKAARCVLPPPGFMDVYYRRTAAKWKRQLPALPRSAPRPAPDRFTYGLVQGGVKTTIADSKAYSPSCEKFIKQEPEEEPSAVPVGRVVPTGSPDQPVLRAQFSVDVKAEEDVPLVEAYSPSCEKFIKQEPEEEPNAVPVGRVVPTGSPDQPVLRAQFSVDVKVDEDVPVVEAYSPSIEKFIKQEPEEEPSAVPDGRVVPTGSPDQSMLQPQRVLEVATAATALEPAAEVDPLLTNVPSIYMLPIYEDLYNQYMPSELDAFPYLHPPDMTWTKDEEDCQITLTDTEDGSEEDGSEDDVESCDDGTELAPEDCGQPMLQPQQDEEDCLITSTDTEDGSEEDGSEEDGSDEDGSEEDGSEEDGSEDDEVSNISVVDTDDVESSDDGTELAPEDRGQPMLQPQDEEDCQITSTNAEDDAVDVPGSNISVVDTEDVESSDDGTELAPEDRGQPMLQPQDEEDCQITSTNAEDGSEDDVESSDDGTEVAPEDRGQPMLQPQEEEDCEFMSTDAEVGSAEDGSEDDEVSSISVVDTDDVESSVDGTELTPEDRVQPILQPEGKRWCNKDYSRLWRHMSELYEHLYIAEKRKNVKRSETRRRVVSRRVTGFRRASKQPSRVPRGIQETLASKSLPESEKRVLEVGTAAMVQEPAAQVDPLLTNPSVYMLPIDTSVDPQLLQPWTPSEGNVGGNTEHFCPYAGDMMAMYKNSYNQYESSDLNAFDDDYLYPPDMSWTQGEEDCQFTTTNAEDGAEGDANSIITVMDSDDLESCGDATEVTPEDCGQPMLQPQGEEDCQFTTTNAEDGAEGDANSIITVMDSDDLESCGDETEVTPEDCGQPMLQPQGNPFWPASQLEQMLVGPAYVSMQQTSHFDGLSVVASSDQQQPPSTSSPSSPSSPLPPAFVGHKKRCLDQISKKIEKWCLCKRPRKMHSGSSSEEGQQ